VWENIPYAVQQDPKGVTRWQHLELGKPNNLIFLKWRLLRLALFDYMRWAVMFCLVGCLCF